MGDKKTTVYDLVEGVLDEVYERAIDLLKERGVDYDSVTRAGCITYSDHDRRATYVIDFNQRKCLVYEGKEDNNGRHD